VAQTGAINIFSLEDREQPRNAQGTHIIPISSGFVREEVAKVDGARFCDHIDGFQCDGGVSSNGMVQDVEG